jgi:hypothetical protein
MEDLPMTDNNTNPTEFQSAEQSHNAEASEPTPEPAAPVITIIEEEPLKMARPLSLVNGKGYAAAWIKVKITVFEGKDNKGILIKYNPPRITMGKRLLIIREDGKTFGESGSLNDLRFEVSLGEKPDPDKTWSGAGVKRYQEGNRPSPSDVFNRLTHLIDHFIDFNRSLADQRIMCELIACWIIATWFLDAFNVTGYLWLNGERGSGKTDLLSLLAELSHLGQFISHTGSFASLRDMADYGATLCFDDAETITYQNDKDQDKRSLLLAGNHRGVKVPLKVPGPDKTWQTRLINAFCPRAFSAIRIPDLTLASRSILIPMVRTSDKKRGNIDPVAFEEWPCDRRHLIDDLWALSLGNLSQMPMWEKWVGKNSTLVGRNLQPWRAILAVARWLEEKGEQGLFQRIQKLSLEYQKERVELELPDFTRVVIQALGGCAISAVCAISAINRKGYFEISVADVVKEALKVIQEDDIAINLDKVTSRVVGMTIGRLRFDSAPRPGGRGSRRWRIYLCDLVQLAESYNVSIPAEIINYQQIAVHEPHPIDGTNGLDGTDGTGGLEASQSNSFMTELSLSTNREKPCYSCGSMDYRLRFDGIWLCNICHPQS